MNQNERNDALDSILDSINMDDTMEKKIDDFARNKQRLKRIERARQNSRQFQEAYGPQPSAEEMEAKTEPSEENASADQKASTVLSTPETPAEENQEQDLTAPILLMENGQPSVYENHTAYDGEDHLDQTIAARPLTPSQEDVSQTLPGDVNQTRVFHKTTTTTEDGLESTGGTRQMKPEEIQELLEEDNAPFLHREYIDNQEEEKPEPVVRTPRKKKKTKSWKMPVIIIGAIAVVALGIGLWFLFANNSKPSGPTDAQTALYEKLKDWAEDYDDYSDEQKKKITDFSSTYNKLTDDQKRDINKILEGMTGKTFDQLLADATSTDKTDTKTDITNTAEKKAKLRGELEALETQRNSTQKKLDEANTAYRENQTQMDQTSGPLEQAKANVDQFTNQVNTLTAQKNDNSALMEEQQSLIDKLKEQITEASAAEEPDQTTIDQLTAQLNDAQTKYNEAQRLYNEANLALPDAQSNLSKAQSSYDKLNSDYEGYRQKRDEASALIGPLQNDLNGLDSSIQAKKNEIAGL